MEGKDKETKPKHRLKGLFSKEQKATTVEEVNDFLHGTSDKLNFPAPAPPRPPPPPTATAQTPRLTPLDTTNARRWPPAEEVQNARIARGRSASPKRSRKGLVVQFTNEKPEIIGFGGDFAELPTISLRTRANSHPPDREGPSTGYRDVRPPGSKKAYVGESGDSETFRPGPLRRTPTRYSSISEAQGAPEVNSTQGGDIHTESHQPSSFAAMIQREMRADEGRALVRAASNPATDELFLRGESPETPTVDSNSPLDELHLNTVKTVHSPPSSSLPPQLTPGRVSTSKGPPQSTSPPSMMNKLQPNSRSSISTDAIDGPKPISRSQTSVQTFEPPMHLSRSATVTLHGAAAGVGDDALNEFTSRIMHLFTLFRLSTESVKPLSKCSPEEIIRAAMWWFLKGRLNLEATVRDRPTSPGAVQANFFARQQAYADLAKAWWIVDTVMPQLPELSSQQSAKDPRMVEIQDARQGIISSLRKLAMSMKRNNFLPPEEAPLPQGLDNSIFFREDAAHPFLLSQKQNMPLSLSDALPLGDSTRNFHYGRGFVEAVLIEEAEAQQYRFPALISLVRNQKERGLTAVITNQSGTFNLCIQRDRASGSGWEDVTWHVKTNAIDIKRPRGFLLRLLCTQQDFRTLFGIYDYQRGIYSSLKSRQDEEVVFESTLKSFQYFDHDTTSTFPKEPLAQCQLKVFEKKIPAQKGAAGGRTLHRGFRLCVVTSPKTRLLRGINQELAPNLPLQLSFLRGEGGLPALLLKIDDARLRYTMVFTFEEVNERSHLHARLTGVALGDRGVVVGEVSVAAFSIADLDSQDSQCLKTLDWQNARVVKEEEEDLQSTKTVLSEDLRVIMDFKTGNLTDRMNTGQGELKFRLGVSSQNELKIFRQRQHDMTISVSSQVSRELPQELAELLAMIARSESVRTYTFPSLEELHRFQAAVTRFTVVFDGLAASFNISRRRMVVPIYKKWDASTTRVQLVQREKVVQLVAFFENFSHGECMNFTLKSTDVFESSSRNGKFSLRIVDAKFALPKGNEGEAAIDNGFVCLDPVEYPGEHDDITIVFDNEAGMSSPRSRVMMAPG